MAEDLVAKENGSTSKELREKIKIKNFCCRPKVLD